LKQSLSICEASVVELVDTLDSKSGFFGSGGSYLNRNRCLNRFSEIFAGVMELVDMTDSKSVAEMRGGSSPPTGTKCVVFQQLIKKGQLKFGLFLCL
jgi:hypothetical protein